MNRILPLLILCGCVSNVSVVVPASPVRAAAGVYLSASAVAALADAVVSARRESQPVLPDDLGNSGSTGGEGGNTDAPTQDATLPVVYLYSTAGCSICERAKGEIAATKKFRLVIKRETPAWVNAYPTLHWQGRDGWKQIRGWYGIEHFRQQYDKSVAEPARQERTIGKVYYARGEYPVRGGWWHVNGGYPGKNEMVEHLLNDGIHKGHFSREWLESLSREQLHSLHSDQHQGIERQRNGNGKR